jgi:hypothetical protein
MTKKIIILLIGCLFISPVYAHKKKSTDKQTKMFHAGGLKKKKHKN